MAAGGALLLVGVVGAVLTAPVLLPSMGPTLAIQLRQPDAPASRLRAAGLGHAVGLAAGVLARAAVRCVPVEVPLPYLADALAGAAALGLTLWGLARLDAEHAPAAATTLIVALGFLPLTMLDLGRAAGALCLCIVLGEGLRRIRI